MQFAPLWRQKSGCVEMAKAKVLVVVCASLLVAAAHICGEAGAEESVLYLINVVPYPNSDPSSGWDRGLELIPAGELAAEEINNCSDLLPGLQLELLHVGSEACGLSLVTDALVNSYGHLVNPNITVVGVVGLFCSSVTDLIAPIADHPNISLLELASSTSPIHRNESEYPLLFHTISSSINYNQAVIRMMKQFGWQRISILHDSLGVYFMSTADDFNERIRQDMQLSLVTQEPTRITPLFIEPVFNSLRNEGGRIVYATATEFENAAILCQAYKRKYTWPGYAYIFTEMTVESILAAVSGLECTVAEVQEAMENVFLLNAVLSSSPDTILVSGKTYQQYFTEYVERLASSLGETINVTTPYANVMYDQVWAFALALNDSLTALDSLNIDIRQFRLGDSLQTSTILADHLENVSFQGAAGYINFTSRREAETPVRIHQVQGGEPVLLYTYYPQGDSLQEKQTIGYIPADRFDSVHVLLPEWLGILFTIVCILCYILTTVILIVYLYWRDTALVKATSPYLSLLIFLGCYLLFTAAIVRTQYVTFFVENETLFIALGNSVIWFGSTGLNLIFATLFVKLLRVYHVFQHFGRTSKFWSDPYLCLGSLLWCLGGIAILTLWTVLDTGYQDIEEDYIVAEPQPYYEVQAVYTSDNIQYFIGGALTYSGILIAFVTFLGIQTRKIKRKNFKDTKKVNAYVIASIFVTGTTLPSYFLFVAVGQQTLAHVSLCTGFILIAVLCQSLLFLPKTLPLLRARNRTRRRQIVYHRSNTRYQIST